ncbi:TIGR03986 family CRISPR-associated RAMP protein [Campylobacter sp. RM13119]|uniref:TIGR03986 family type III CRISPR-associated RAMP protein n=1 Tax=Campylobacter californiensis TaxID=1032243 RepID=UPI0014750DBF|nr:TIGR03986 family CRISPR-associated RAMP protein [Campylobacter sp. RM13119]MBE3606710.1 TIGR03986 family CRISPR-associated RAMP protein [Campylobacter sp. RM13119]
MITSPYNFVPLNDEIYYPSWASDEVLENIHDVPLKDGESGVIELEITAKSPIFIKNHVKKSEENDNGVKEFCHFNNGKSKHFYIPATSLKGMIRNTLEIMSFSAMSFIDDKTYSQRDLSSKDYKEKVLKNIQCGWLYKDENGEYSVDICDGIYRIRYEEIGNKFGIKDYKDIFLYGNFDERNSPLKNAKEKYKLVGFDACQKIYTFSRSGDSNGRKLVKFSDDGDLKGRVVLTGHPTSRKEGGERRPSGKIQDFVFIERGTPYILKVSKKAFDDFKFAYFDGRTKQPKESADWTFWKEKLQNGYKIPVFFHKIKGKNEVRSFGLSYLYKLPYDKSTLDTLNDAHKQQGIDLAELIFGYSKEIDGKQSSLKSRVFISHAKAMDNAKEESPVTIQLGSPKASYYPNYIVQDSFNMQKNYNSVDAQLSGWKRYPIHKSMDIKSVSKSTQTTTIKPLKEGVKFRCKIVLHNLLPVEIGALLSAITFHGTSDCYHNIGMAKPLGYGKVKLEVLNMQDLKMSVKEYLEVFEADMNANLFGHNIKWHESQQIKNLLTMASEQSNKAGTNAELKYMELSEFAKVKNKHHLERYTKLQDVITKIPTPLSTAKAIVERKAAVSKNSNPTKQKDGKEPQQNSISGLENLFGGAASYKKGKR